MSKPEDTTTPVVQINPDAVSDEVVEKRPNILVRGYRKIRKDPKTTLAVVGGTALVAGAAFLGRKSAPSCDTPHADAVDNYDGELLEIEQEANTP